MTTKIVKPTKDLKILPNWDEVLRIIWKKCKKRDWQIYDTSPFRKFWDTRPAEKREKKDRK